MDIEEKNDLPTGGDFETRDPPIEKKLSDAARHKLMKPRKAETKLPVQRTWDEEELDKAC